jgi:uncharacterized membrane protein YozB (DUF420 family)
MSQLGGALKVITMPLVAVTDLMKSTEDQQKGGAEGVTVVTADNIISIASTVIFMLLAGYLCWKCNAKEDGFLRVVYTILAVLFNTFYLIYYFIYRYMMGNPCPV